MFVFDAVILGFALSESGSVNKEKNIEKKKKEKKKKPTKKTEMNKGKKRCCV